MRGGPTLLGVLLLGVLPACSAIASFPSQEDENDADHNSLVGRARTPTGVDEVREAPRDFEAPANGHGYP